MWKSVFSPNNTQKTETFCCGQPVDNLWKSEGFFHERCGKLLK